MSRHSVGLLKSTRKEWPLTMPAVTNALASYQDIPILCRWHDVHEETIRLCSDMQGSRLAKLKAEAEKNISSEVIVAQGQKLLGHLRLLKLGFLSLVLVLLSLHSHW